MLFISALSAGGTNGRDDAQSRRQDGSGAWMS
jgi:hypothetical protein